MRRMLFGTVLTVLIALPISAGTPYLVKDINQHASPAAGSYPNSFLTFGSLVLFTTNTSTGTPLELWRTDGTSAGTFKLGGKPGSFVVWNGKVWFTSNGLWSTDGTVAGTQQFVLPADVPAPAYLMPGPSHLYLFNQGRLWRTDGTTAGTKQLTTAPLSSEFATASGSAALGSTLYLLTTFLDMSDLWKVDAGGVVSKVKDLQAPGSHLTTAGNLLYLSVSGRDGIRTLWQSNGTDAGTFPLRPAARIALKGIPGFVTVGSVVYFTGNDGTGNKLWRTDGTNTSWAATSLPGASATFDAYPVGRFTNGTLLLSGPGLGSSSGESGLWTYDGTTTTYLSPGQLAYPPPAPGAVMAGTYTLFPRTNEIWRTDGTVAGTYSIGAFPSGSSFNFPTGSIGSKVIFGGRGNDYGVELWQTTGTVGSISMVKDIVEGTNGSRPAHLTPFRGGILFDALGPVQDVPPIGERRDLWFSDGTEAGTRKLFADWPIQGTYEVCGNRAFLQHSTPEAGEELWTTDGTVAGTAMVADLFPGNNSSTPAQFRCVDGVAFFIAGPYGARSLWRSDGTAAGTLMVRPLDALPENLMPPRVTMVAFRHQLYFVVRGGNSTTQLWRSDGTTAGTVMVKDFPSGGFEDSLYVAGDVLYVETEPGPSRSILWRSDGTAAGTTVLLDGRGFGNWPVDFFGRLTYRWFDTAANNTTIDRGLCTTDGSNAGTCFMPADPFRPEKMLAANGRLYYNDGGLRSTDGLSETHSGVGMIDKLLGTGGGLLYGSYAGGIVGAGVFVETDGTPAGTRTLAPRITEAVSSGGRVFLAGEELYALDSDVTPTGLSPASVAPPGGQTVTITGRGFSGPVTVKVGGVNATVGTVTPTAITFTAPAHDAGFYTVDLTLGGGQRMLLEQQLAYSCSLTATATVNPAAVCPFTPVTLQGSGGTRCAWFPAAGLDDPSSCTPKASAAATTSYTLIVFGTNGCASANYPRVTVNVIAPPDPAITLAGVAPGNAIASKTSFTASVPDAGAGATYAWTGTGVTITGSTAGRTLTFSTTCARTATLQVTITAATGCTSTQTKTLYIIGPTLSSFSPTTATPNTIITITGTSVDCAGPLQLRGYDEATRTAFYRPLNVVALNRTTAQFRMPADALSMNRIEEVNYTNYQPISTYDLFRANRLDLYGIKSAEVVWRNSATGATSIWSYHYAFNEVTGSASLSVPASWTLAAFGDFDGDTRTDIFWHNPATGETSIWLMNAPTPFATVRSTSVPVGWKPAGSGDFNADGKADLFWHNPATGETSIWFMNGTAGFTAIRSLTIPTGWIPAAFGDFNVDGIGDIFWRKPSTGETSIWLMNGTGTPATAVRSDTVPAPWTLAGSVDYNGDRKDDLIWHNPDTGATQIWQLDGAAIASKVAGITMPLGFRPAVAAHFDPGLAGDVFWYNPTTGETALSARDFSAHPRPISMLPRVSDLNWKPVIVP